MHDVGLLRDPGRHNTSELTSTSAGPERRKSRRDTKRKSSRDFKKLQRDPERRRTYSFSPGRKDSIRVPRTLDRPPVPPLPAIIQGDVRSDTDLPDPVTAGDTPLRARKQPAEDTQHWQRMPTLHKRSGQELAHRKSSKKRKEEHQREAEIKAMVAYMPRRPAADPTSSGRPMKRENKKMSGGLDRHGETSDVSLPLADSLRSSVSANSDHQPSYILNAFGMLAPRPTIRYAENPRYVPGASGFGGSDGSGSRKKRASDRISVPKEALKANKRIDDLADDLDAAELRELMERDQKRREKKQIADRIKVERRLARRQQKQTEDEATAAREGTSIPTNMERGVLGREIVGLGIGTSAVMTSSKRKGSVGSDNGREKRPADAFRQDSGPSIQPPTFHRSESLLTENLTPTSEFQDPVLGTAVVGTVGRANISRTSSTKLGGHARGESSISQRMDLARPELAASQPIPIPAPAIARRNSQRTRTPPAKQPQSWTSFFRIRGGKKQQQESAPSSFSNTSRDSMHSGHGPQIGYAPMRSTSNIPKRTLSKFREDLPELPMSPPDSRVQSPEADIVPPVPDRKFEDSRTRYDTPTSGYRSIEAIRLRDETPTSGHRTFEDPSPEPPNILSQSLASIDSEGSWLSGRKAGSKRGSIQTPQPFLESSIRNEFSESAEELGIVEDEYFSRLSPGPEEQHKIHRQIIGNPMPSSDDEEGGSLVSPASVQSKWGAVGRQPTVVHREPRAKSREGLLNEFDEDSASETDSPVSPNPNSGLRRATSVDLGKKHGRHISAGSARLLDLKARPSADIKRDSLAE
ncbi:uncharacterized protein RSE6_02186 [Rhynchosporium secalis]|uniref:Uncharacterized protein n=1 Tax=Rhynchosporium secalis TaxID=38038 RepID=A0A1E1LZN8_RHYSE|nr:uncharacterized protein RSE6_02186 [Rhynchosporium secalis]